MNLHTLGWDRHFADQYERMGISNAPVGRVMAVHGKHYLLGTEQGECLAELSGQFQYRHGLPAQFPAVGDWVVLGRTESGSGTLRAVIERRSQFSRLGPDGREQVLAANVDTALLVNGLDGDFNVRRIERYLVLAWESGVSPVVVLNKADCCPEVQSRVRAVERVAAGVPVVALSATGDPVAQALAPWLVAGRTLALLGSSGVGKSTIANALLGEARQAVGAVREDDSRGRHTTTHRQLLVLPGGALLIDAPGMRELQLLAGEESVQAAFEDIERLAGDCRFRDCGHVSEPGCAVRSAIEAGELSQARLEGYRKLLREVRHLERRQDLQATLAEKARWKRIHRSMRDRQKP